MSYSVDVRILKMINQLFEMPLQRIQKMENDKSIIRSCLSFVSGIYYPLQLMSLYQ